VVVGGGPDRFTHVRAAGARIRAVCSHARVGSLRAGRARSGRRVRRTILVRSRTRGAAARARSRCTPACS
jgi:hypothetical protein